jgi:hypothetical protein
VVNWKKLNHNYILEGDGFFVSFIPSNANPWLGTIFNGDRPDGMETAIVKDGKYYILNGDFRKDYEKLVDKGFNACKKFFDKNEDESGSSWSN